MDVRIARRIRSLAPALLLLAACSGASDSGVDAQPQASTNAAVESAETPAPIAEPLNIGSQDARDDLYCAGVLIAANPESYEALSPTETAVVMKAHNLAMVLSVQGTGKLIQEGVASAPQTGAVADAWVEEAIKDFDAGAPRLALDACTARAEAVPVAQ